MDKNIILVRSGYKLIGDNLIGYGWSQVNFKKYNNGKDLIKLGFKEKGIEYGRKRKQIERFQNIKSGDIIVVPVNRAIVIGIATDKKFYVENENLDIPYSSNRIEVVFFRKDSKVINILRSELDMNLEQRLKIRTTIANLNDFREEILQIVQKIQEGKSYERSTVFAEKEENAKNDFIKSILKRMRTGKGLGIRAGGTGLETLIEEVFKAKNYETFIPSKNSKNRKNKLIADVDVVAYRDGEFSTKGEVLLIQAKHHKGTTGDHGVKQLEAIKDFNFGKYGEFSEDDYTIKKVLVTTAEKDVLNNSSIDIINGESFAEWLYDNLSLLSKDTKERLGISEIPTLI